MGAWIEIRETLSHFISCLVAPLVGAWIEILMEVVSTVMTTSLLSWERGLKYGIKAVTKSVRNGRSSRGSVD